MAIINDKRCTCFKCNHLWILRGTSIPKSCPKCKTRLNRGAPLKKVKNLKIGQLWIVCDKFQTDCSWLFKIIAKELTISNKNIWIGIALHGVYRTVTDEPQDLLCFDDFGIADSNSLSQHYYLRRKR